MNIEKIRKVLENSKLCTGNWVEIGFNQKIENLCPISALLKASGVSDNKILALREVSSFSSVWDKYGHILAKDYDMSQREFLDIINDVDDHPNAKQDYIVKLVVGK